MSKPSNTSWNHKQNWEHVSWKTHRLVNYTAVEINVGVQFSFYEKWIVQCYFLEFNSDLNEFFFAGNFKHLMCDLLYYFSSWVITFVNSMTKSVKKFLSTFNVLNKLRNVLFFSNLLKHSQNSFVGSSMFRTI